MYVAHTQPSAEVLLCSVLGQHCSVFSLLFLGPSSQILGGFRFTSSWLCSSAVPVLLGHDWRGGFVFFFLKMSQTRSFVIKKLEAWKSCKVSTDFSSSNLKLPSLIIYLFIVYITNILFTSLIYLHLFIIFLVDFQSFQNFQNYKTLPGCLKQWEQFTRGALNPGNLFASFITFCS